MLHNYNPWDLGDLYDDYGGEYLPAKKQPTKKEGCCNYRLGQIQEKLGTFEMKGKDYRMSDRDIISTAQRHPDFRDMPWCPEGKGRLEFRVKNISIGFSREIAKKRIELWCPHCYADAMRG